MFYLRKTIHHNPPSYCYSIVVIYILYTHSLTPTHSFTHSEMTWRKESSIKDNNHQQHLCCCFPPSCCCPDPDNPAGCGVKKKGKQANLVVWVGCTDLARFREFFWERRENKSHRPTCLCFWLQLTWEKNYSCTITVASFCILLNRASTSGSWLSIFSVKSTIVITVIIIYRWMDGKKKRELVQVYKASRLFVSFFLGIRL